MIKAEEAERQRLANLEKQLIEEMRLKLASLLNEKAKMSDVRESDTKEFENID